MKPKYKDFLNILKLIGCQEIINFRDAYVTYFKNHYDLNDNIDFTGTVIIPPKEFCPEENIFLLFNSNDEYIGYCNSNNFKYTEELICTILY